MNSTPANNVSQSIVGYELYWSCGIAATATNIMCFVVILTNRWLRENLIFFALLAFGNVCNALGVALAGYLRTKYILALDFDDIRAIDCLRRPWLHLMLFGKF